MSRETQIQARIQKALNLDESKILILSSILNRAGNEDSDIKELISIIEDIEENAFTKGQESKFL